MGLTETVVSSVVGLPSSLSSLDLEPLHSFSKNAAANIRATGYMLMGSGKAFYWVKPTVGQFMLFGVTALLSNFMFYWLIADEATHFNQQGLISYLVWPMVMLVSGLVLAKRHHNAMLIFVPAILWLAADTLMALVQSGLQWLGRFGWLPEIVYPIIKILFTVLFVWQSLSLLWIFGKKLRWSWLEQVLILLGAFAVFSVWQSNVRSQPIFQSDPIEPIISEQDFYAQPILLDKALAQVEQQRSNHVDWYFLGVAGHGEQDVFRSEIEQTKTYFDENFGTAGRSLALVNNAHTLQRLPIASKTSIERAVQTMGKKMDSQQDVLFLSLTSHGNQDILEVSNPPLELDDVDSGWLSQTLDKSGIKWRVIVISACYSGSFIEQLKTPYTLIITASAADKASFGCSNEAQWTYFGQAFFAQSLPKFKHVLPAFDDTKKTVAKRERLMGFEPSQPQLFIGDKMQQALPILEKTLSTQATSVNSTLHTASQALP